MGSTKEAKSSKPARSGSVIEWRRVWMTVFGVIGSGIAVGCFSYSVMGLDPFQVFAHGLWNLTDLQFGTWYLILNACMLVVIFIVNRRKIGLGTLINLFLLGYVADGSEVIIRMVFPNDTLPVRIVMLIIGIVLMCFSAAIYFTADMGVSTYDAVAITISEHCAKIPFRFIRIATDLACVVIGWFFGGTVGIGTVVTAFFTGPLIDFFKRTTAEPLLYGRKRKN